MHTPTNIKQTVNLFGSKNTKGIIRFLSFIPRVYKIKQIYYLIIVRATSIRSNKYLILQTNTLMFYSLSLNALVWTYIFVQSLLHPVQWNSRIMSIYDKMKQRTWGCSPLQIVLVFREPLLDSADKIRRSSSYFLNFKKKEPNHIYI